MDDAVRRHTDHDHRTDFAVIVMHLGETMGESISKPRLATYWRSLESYPLDVIREAALFVAENHSRFPSLADLRGVIGEVLRRRREAEEIETRRQHRAPERTPQERAVVQALAALLGGRSIEGVLECSSLDVGEFPVREIALAAVARARAELKREEGETLDDHFLRIQREQPLRLEGESVQEHHLRIQREHAEAFRIGRQITRQKLMEARA